MLGFGSIAETAIAELPEEAEAGGGVVIAFRIQACDEYQPGLSDLEDYQAGASALEDR